MKICCTANFVDNEKEKSYNKWDNNLYGAYIL